MIRKPIRKHKNNYALLAAACFAVITCTACSNDANSVEGHDCGTPDHRQPLKTVAKSESSEPVSEISSETTDLKSDSEYMHPAELPLCNPKPDAVYEDYQGLWECEVMSRVGMVYDTLGGAPLNAFFRLEIRDDNTGREISVAPAYNAETEVNTAEFACMLTDTGWLRIEFDDVPGEISARCMDNGYLFLQADSVKAYYKKVDAFTDFDFKSSDFDWEQYYDYVAPGASIDISGQG